MKIGELALATGTPVESVRFYEREGLLPEPARTAGNYRVYEGSDVERLAFIRHCRSLDMALDEIRTLLRFKDAPVDNCSDVNELLDEHIGHVAARIAELRSLEAQLKQLRAQCSASSGAACGILEELSQAPARSKTNDRAHIGGAHGEVRRPAKTR
ncbi:MAG: Cd(II)/Pb(II)-responsive transcriptional regulator [Caldimonas sp.]